ncbi:MAG: hypothetical protein ACYTXC_28645 [Nostoc sp.]
MSIANLTNNLLFCRLSGKILEGFYLTDFQKADKTEIPEISLRIKSSSNIMDSPPVNSLEGICYSQKTLSQLREDEKAIALVFFLSSLFLFSLPQRSLRLCGSFLLNLHK